ncbi:hypothetical protein [Schlesneria paludicola]|nr:hypothetical protein [Schlesneria paludicola]
MRANTKVVLMRMIARTVLLLWAVVFVALVLRQCGVLVTARV